MHLDNTKIASCLPSKNKTQQDIPIRQPIQYYAIEHYRNIIQILLLTIKKGNYHIYTININATVRNKKYFDRYLALH